MQMRIPASFSQLIIAIIIITPALLLSSCMNPQGTRMTKEQAFAYFKENREELQSIVNDIVMCDPIIPEGIYYTINKRNISELKCKSDKSDIKLSLIKRIENLNLNPIGLIGDYNNNNKLSAIVFNYYSIGLSVSGTTEEFTYSINEVKEVENLNEGNNSKYLNVPLTDRPWHWIWVVTQT
jgi:hypothetical protein